MQRTFRRSLWRQETFVLLLSMTWLGGLLPKDVRGQPKEEGPRRGVVVTELRQGTALEQAGAQVGDWFLSWERLPNPPLHPQGGRGEIGSVFDWQWMTVEEAPRGPLRLTGRRDGQVRTFELPAGFWEGFVRPAMPGGILEPYLRGKEELEAGDLEAAVDWWNQVAAAEGESASDLRCWMLLRIGWARSEAEQWESAHKAFRAALKEAHVAKSQVVVWQTMARVYERQRDFAKARQAYTEAQEIRRRTWGEGLAFAMGLRDLAQLAWWEGRFESAETDLLRALELRRTLAPDSLGVARALYDLGLVVARRGRQLQATEYHEGALEIKERLAPKSHSLAASLTYLGNLAVGRGDLKRAAQYHKRALEIQQELAPRSLAVAMSLTNLGNVALSRGELQAAMDYLERSLEIKQELQPASRWVASSLTSLADVAELRGELQRAMHYNQAALEVLQKQAPDSNLEAKCRANLGKIAARNGDLKRAVEEHQQALEIFNKTRPGSLALANNLQELGVALQLSGRPHSAVGHYRRALAIQQELAPNRLDAARSLYHLGTVAFESGDLTLATDHLKSALEIQERLAKGSSAHTETLHALGNVLRGQNRPETALDYHLAAIRSLEKQLRKLGGSHDIKGAFRAQYSQLYRHTLELHLELGQPDKAFHVLERSRAQSFLALLAERDLVFTDVPPELEHKRRYLAVRQDRLFQQMADLDAKEQDSERELLAQELMRLEEERHGIIEELRRVSPQVAALEYPEALDLSATQEALDPGTVMLSYSVGKKRTDLFVVTPHQGFVVKTLVVGEDELRRVVDVFRRFIADRRNPRSQGFSSVLSRGKLLFDLLLEPAAEALAAAERVLIVPDGPLHGLPWGALVRPASETAGDWQYLAEWKSFHIALSATVYAELRRSRPEPQNGAGVTLVAFGDPYFPNQLPLGAPEAIADVRVRSLAERGFAFVPLPASRLEVEQIAALYPTEARVFLGREATEERAKAVDRRTRYLHFATHGTLDEDFPLNSAVALTLPEKFIEGKDNGLLQAWEIFEGTLRIDADLVVLSSCESALGKEVRGEGLNGLTRAFHYAGARSVAASLWRVRDETTAALMTRFYRHLKAGKSKGDALRSAQVELIRRSVPVHPGRHGEDGQGQTIGKDTSAPYYWAAFQIYGDWR